MAILHFRHQSLTNEIIFCSELSLGAIKTISSAYKRIDRIRSLTSTPQFNDLIPVARSFRYKENNKGLMISPCLTPDDTLNESVIDPFSLIWNDEEANNVDKLLKSRPCMLKEVASL